jgi:hypothetical protein
MPKYLQRSVSEVRPHVTARLYRYAAFPELLARQKRSYQQSKKIANPMASQAANDAWIVRALVMAVATCLLLAYPGSTSYIDSTPAAEDEEQTQQYVASLCLMLPLFAPPLQPGGDISASPFGVLPAHGMLLAAKHINRGDCSVLGPGCSNLLATDGSSGRRLSVRPLLQNHNYQDPQGAPRVVQACTGTDAEVLIGPFVSEEATKVASFIGGLGAEDARLCCLLPKYRTSDN